MVSLNKALPARSLVVKELISMVASLITANHALREASGATKAIGRVFSGLVLLPGHSLASPGVQVLNGTRGQLNSGGGY